MDSGVELFAKETIQDYPASFHKKYVGVAQMLTRIYGNQMWCVIPDYPDDFGNNPVEHNVEKTLTNIEKYHSIENVNWVYPLQADFLDLKSFYYACQQVKEYNPERVAIGSVCKMKNIAFIIKCCSVARQVFPNSWIYAFGLTLKALPYVFHLLDSFDSSAYYTSRGAGQRMCTTQAQRLEYFKKYLKRIDEIIYEVQKQKTLSFHGEKLVVKD